LTAGVDSRVKGFEARSCEGTFKTYKEINNNPAAANPNGTSTWIGKLKCSELETQPACNQVKIITATRSCVLENGNTGGCDYCANAADPDESFMKDLLADTAAKVGGMVTSSSASRCFFQAVCHHPENTPGCPTVPSGGHVFCLAPDTKIQMADGSEKEIKDIRAGEYVNAFDAKHSKKGKLRKAKVEATTITKEQDIIKINNLEITPKHKVVLASGRAVEAKNINIGDKILLANGEVEKVKTIDNERPKIDVYNLILEKTSEGYIANGMKVLSYPMEKGAEKVLDLNK